MSVPKGHKSYCECFACKAHRRDENHDRVRKILSGLRLEYGHLHDLSEAEITFDQSKAVTEARSAVFKAIGKLNSVDIDFVLKS